MKKAFSCVLVMIVALALPAYGGGIESPTGGVEERTSGTTARVSTGSVEESHMKIRLSIGNNVLTATMLNNETSSDFLALLPLAATFKDYSGTEKITYLSKRLSTKGAPSGTNPSVGDIAYYSPWGNIAIFYRDFEYSEGLIKLGHVDSGIEKLAGMEGEFAVTIEPVNE